LLKFYSDFIAAHRYPPRPALPPFRVELALCRGLASMGLVPKPGGC